MNLSLSKDKILLKNCIVVKLQQLKLAEGTPAIKDEISYYENIYEILKADDTETLMLTLKDPTFKEAYRNFNEHILSTPAKEVAEEYIDLTKSLMVENGVYDEEKFKQLKAAFYKGNEEYEEEPEQHPSTHLTEPMKNYLEKLKSLIRHANPNTMSATEFKNFSAKFRDITKFIAASKFQQYFDGKGQTLSDMNIFYDAPNYGKTLYRTDLKLLDANFQETQLSLSEPTVESESIANYYQNLCFSYLQADKYSKIEETLLTPNMITLHMKTFSRCYEKLKEMCNYKMNILSNNKVAFSIETSFEPTPLDYELAANANSDVINFPSRDDSMVI